MSRKDFMGRLQELLVDIPAEERVEAMAYYHSYFEDAGEENEERVIRELESPEKVADIIKAELAEGLRNQGAAEEAGKQGAAEGAKPDPWGDVGYDKKGKQEKDNTVKIVLTVLLAVVTSPLWLSLLATIIGMIGGVLGCLIGLGVGLVAAALGLCVGGFALLGLSWAEFGSGMASSGFGLAGMGFLMLALALLGAVLCAWMFGRLLPWTFRGIVSLCRKAFPKKKVGGYAS